MSPDVYERYARPNLLEALGDSPAVLIHGPRQSGKTTLAQEIGRDKGFVSYSFDDGNLVASARADPMGFVAELPAKAILDEVQKVPEIFAPLKLAIDRDRRPGRFLLAGSTNVLLVPELSDSLAGRMEIVRLHSLAQCEIERTRPNFLDHLFEGTYPPTDSRRLGSELMERIVAGGFPAALARPQIRRRRAWYQSYLESLVQRDIRDMAQLSHLDVVPRLLAVAASQTARLFNVTDLASPFQVSRPTIRDYLVLLERIFVLELLPPWHTNLLSRLVKTPKLHLSDTGLASAVLGLDVATLAKDRDLLGRLLETFVVGELRRQASWADAASITFHHFRDRDGLEVDLILERNGLEIAGVEVKASGSVTDADFRALRHLRDGLGERFRMGVVLYDGDRSLSFGGRMYAVPIRALWADSVSVGRSE